MRAYVSVLAIFALGVVVLATTGCSKSATAPRSDAYFTGHVAAAEYRLVAKKTPIKKGSSVPPESLYGAYVDGVDYQEARKLFNDPAVKRPILIIIHAEWCGPCNRMIKLSIPRVKNLDSVSLVYVDVDEDPELSKKLSSETKVPQVILYYYDKEGVASKKHEVGAKSAEELEELIRANLNLPDVR